MSVTVALISEATQHVSRYLADTIPNPPAQAPGGGAEDKINQLIGIVKWGTLVVIAVAAFVGVGAVAGGKILTNHRSSHFGMQVLIADAIAVVLYGSVIGALALF